MLFERAGGGVHKRATEMDLLRAWQCSGGNSGVYIGGVISSEVSALLCSLCLARTSSCPLRYGPVLI
jgi:hypothetical protein